MTPPDPKTIYEINDTSDDESYYPVGIFLSLPEAIAAIESEKEPWTLSEYGDDNEFVKLEIRERKLGFSGHGRKAWERSWSYNYRTDTDANEWRQEP